MLHIQVYIGVYRRKVVHTSAYMSDIASVANISQVSILDRKKQLVASQHLFLINDYGEENT